MLNTRTSDIPKEIVDIVNENEKEIPESIAVETINLRSDKKEPVLMPLDKRQLVEIMNSINVYLLERRCYAIFKNNFEIEVHQWDYSQDTEKDIFLKPDEFMIRDFEIIEIQGNDPQVRNVETLNYRIIETAYNVLRIVKYLLAKFNIRCNEQFFYELPDLSKWGDWND